MNVEATLWPFGKCTECANKNYCTWSRSEIESCINNGYLNFSRMTNADHIRAMTDEKLAVFESTLGCHPAATKETCIGVDYCAECWLDWLKKEADA